MAWKNQGQGENILSMKEQYLVVSQQGSQTRCCCCQEEEGIDWVQEEEFKHFEEFSLGKENNISHSAELLKLKNNVTCKGTREVFTPGPFDQKQEA